MDVLAVDMHVRPTFARSWTSTG